MFPTIFLSAISRVVSIEIMLQCRHPFSIFNGPNEKNMYFVMNSSRVFLSSVLIFIIILVYGQPEGSGSGIKGIVIDLETQQPLCGVLVTAGSLSTETLGDGHYFLALDPGQYDLMFEKTGYCDLAVENVNIFPGDTAIVNTGMWEANYPPGFAEATVGTSGLSCEVSWVAPYGAYEMILDDGTAEDLFVFAQSGSQNAVKFTPPTDSTRVFGVKVFVGDGSFPGNFLGTDVGFAVYDDDGPGGLPGTMLDSDTIKVTGYGWIECNSLDALVESGSFYLSMIQLTNAPGAAPVGVDTGLPIQYRSYSKFQSGSWSLSALQDFMIRARVYGWTGYTDLEPETTPGMKYTPRVPSYWRGFAQTLSNELPSFLPAGERNDMKIKGLPFDAPRDVTEYRVVRYSGFDPDSLASTGNITQLATATGFSHDDILWEYLPMGWYAYGISALYSSGMESDTTITNTVGHLMDCSVTLDITTNNSLPPVNVEVEMSGNDYPYETHTILTDSSGSHVFDRVWKGSYDLSLYKPGYDTLFLPDVAFWNDTVLDIELQQKRYQVYDLMVDSMTLWATWSEPLVTAVYEDFENGQFPPEGWQSETQGTGWHRTRQAHWGGAPIPAWDSYYAVAIDDGKKRHPGSYNNGCCDYLITPPMDLRERDEFVLYFDSYFTGAYGQEASIEYSFNNGQSWEVLYQLTPYLHWTPKEIDLSGLSGPGSQNKIWIAFHADDAGGWATGWAVDNIRIQSPEPAAEYLDFNVYLDDIVQGVTPEISWPYAPLTYGDTFTAAVTARYLSGHSEIDTFQFVSKYLPPPTGLTAESFDDYVVVNWLPPDLDSLSYGSWGRETPDNLLGYNLYKEDSLLAYVGHDSTLVYQEYMDMGLLPGHYDYSLEAVYDLTTYGFPGDTNVSVMIGPVEATVSYCINLEFFEDWGSGSFDLNDWEVQGENWNIEGNAGNPPPSAEFQWSPVTSDYELILASPFICAFGLDPGDVWLSFDIALESVASTGEEHMEVQIWQWEGRIWETLAAYDNSEGSFEWISETIKISDIVWDGIFRIRFAATGSSSLDIHHWSVDNIHFFRTCAPPQNLTVEPLPNFSDILVTWFPPEGAASDEWIHWDDGVNYTSVGTGSQVEFEVAARWEPSQLTNYPNMNITEVSFYPVVQDAVYHVRIWTGGGQFGGPESMILDQPITSITAGQWNVIALDSPVGLDISKMVWIGYFVNTPGGHPLGCDAGPAVEGYGNMINYYGWQTLRQINPDLDYNWNIQAHLVAESGETTVLNPASPETMESQGVIASNPVHQTSAPVFTPPGNTRGLEGYNIYRKKGNGSYSWYDFVAGDTLTKYIDKELEPGVIHCYKVTAQYDSEIGTCESDFSNHGCTFVTVGTGEWETRNFRMFPNPADRLVRIETIESFGKISLYSQEGVLLFSDENIENNHYLLNTISLANGIYLIRVQSGNNCFYGKIVIAR